ncbi:hypothetical protein YC2023_109046 [Brassica napus]
MSLYREKEWYFFTPRDRKYQMILVQTSAAGTGYWNVTGAHKPVGKPKTLPNGRDKALKKLFQASKQGEVQHWNVELVHSSRSLLKQLTLDLVHTKQGICP